MYTGLLDGSTLEVLTIYSQRAIALEEKNTESIRDAYYWLIGSYNGRGYFNSMDRVEENGDRDVRKLLYYFSMFNKTAYEILDPKQINGSNLWVLTDYMKCIVGLLSKLDFCGCCSSIQYFISAMLTGDTLLNYYTAIFEIGCGKVVYGYSLTDVKVVHETVKNLWSDLLGLTWYSKAISMK